ncbi:MAG: XTP/dITP diphosphatase [Syntrophomonadaceae bacterium]|nr:XTP/dITP diphosphatase [Syntrophomonadaceae bacterium]
MKKLLVATRNKGKLKELEELLSPLGIEVISLADIPAIPEIEEDGDSFTANAIKKAQETSRLTGYTCLADDSGLVVDALGGQPGIYSARFAGENASDEENNNKLLELMKNVEAQDRTARFVCVIALADANGKIATVEGICEGMIGFTPQGENGFGYDPLFIPHGFNKTFAELSSEEKQQISHRGQALRKAIPVIESFIK